MFQPDHADITSIDWSNPVSDHPLNRGRIGWWLNVPHWQGGTTWRALIAQQITTVAITPSTFWSRDSHQGGWGSVDLDGSNDAIRTTETDLANFKPGFSMSCWVRSHQLKSVDLFFSRGTKLHGFYQNASGYPFFYAQTVAATQAVSIATNTWMHLAGVYLKSNRLKLYKNGVEVGSGTAPTTDMAVNATWSSDGAGLYYNGQLDDISLWDRALSAAEVADLYDRSLNYNQGLLRQIPLVIGSAPAAGDTFTGSAAITTGAATAAASGTFTAGTFTGTSAITTGAATSAASGTFTTGTFTGTSAITTGAATSAGSGTFVAGTFTGSSAITIGAATSAAIGEFAASVSIGTSAITTGAATSAASGTFVTLHTGTAAATAGGAISAATGTFVAGTFTATAAPTIAAATAAASGTFAASVSIGTSAITTGAAASASSGTFVAGTFTGTSAATAGAATAAASGTFSTLLFTATSTITIGAATAAASGTNTPPGAGFATITFSGGCGYTLEVQTRRYTIETC